MNLYVGNLNYATTEEELRPIFEEYGQVNSVKMIMDRETGRPKGFAFVEMANAQQAQQAIDGVNGTTVSGRPIVVNEARPKPQGGGRPQGGGHQNYGDRNGSGNRNSNYGGSRDNRSY